MSYNPGAPPGAGSDPVAVEPVPALIGSGENRVTSGDWRALMMAAQSGDAADYRRLLAEVGSWLQRYYRKRLPSPVVHDAVQDALLALHQKRHTYDPSKPFGPWLAAIARHKWIDRLRAMQAASTQMLAEDLAEPDPADATEDAHTLEALLRRLKPAQAEAIRLVKLEGRSIKDASARTGQTISLVKVNIHRGLKRLSALAQDPSDDP